MAVEHPSATPRRHDACPICGYTGLVILPAYQRAHLVRCRGCGHVFSRLIPGDKDLALHYRHYGADGCTSAITQRRYAELLESFEPARRENRILDFGCGVGDFLVSAADRGWEVAGVEIGRSAVETCHARGIPLLEEPLERHVRTAGSFDVVTFIEVLEHLAFPSHEMAAARHLLRQDGLLYLTTPNFAGLGRRLLGPRWPMVDYPEHLGYFSPSTVARLLESHGFARIELRTSGLGVGQFRAVQGGAPKRAASGDEALRVATEESSALGTIKRIVNRGLAATRLGDTVKALYRAV
jgi:2-polyprenyl-3-methyl-5-hydroxy-6-metoxy-1,4-benzoquinol methylase